MISSWFPTYETTCPDAALLAYDAMSDDEKVIPRMFFWIGMLLSLEQTVHALTLASLSRRKDLRASIQIYPTFKPPTATILLWVLFTGIAIGLIGFTFRSNAAILAKTIHVIAEALFLIAICTAFGYHQVAGAVGVIATIAGLLVFSLPCTESVEFASRSGMALDAVNFLAYSWYGLSNPTDKALWLFIWALGCHVVYLLTAIVVSRNHGTDSFLVTLRIIGLFSNIVASEFFLWMLRRELHINDGGNVNLRSWANQRDRTVCVWTKGGLKVSSLTDETRDISPFAIGSTAYASGVRYHGILALFPISGRAIVEHTDGKYVAMFSFLCSFKRFVNVTISDALDEETGFVLGWMHVRAVYQGFFVLFATFVAIAWP